MSRRAGPVLELPARANAMTIPAALRAPLFAAASLVAAAPPGCATVPEKVLLLEHLHEEDGAHRAAVPRRPSVFDRLGEIFLSKEESPSDLEELENPTAECHEAIDDVREGTFDEPTVTVRAAAILSRVAERDPSPLGRAMAVAALGRFGRDVVGHSPDAPRPGGEAAAAAPHVDTVIRVHEIGPVWAHRPEIEGSRSACLEAVRTLSGLAFPSSVEARAVARLLASVVEFDPDEEIRDTARRGSLAVARQAVSLTLVAALADPTPEVRAEAARVLGTFRDPSFVAPLGARLAKEENPEVARTVARSLGVIGDGHAVRFLAPALEGEDESVDLQLRLSLREITNLPFANSREWREWWRESGEAYEKKLGGLP